MFYFGTGTGYGARKTNIKPNDLMIMIVDLRRGYLRFQINGSTTNEIIEDIDLLNKYKITAWRADQVQIVSMQL